MIHGKILIIDDTPANIGLLTATLEPRGYEIFAASGGDQGLKVAARVLPDVILLDIMMPGRDGFAVCRALKAAPETREIPVLFITAKQESAAIVRAFQSGAVDYILKPFRDEEVVSRVETHLRINRLVAELRRKNEELEAQITRRKAAEKARQTADERLSSLSARETQRWGLAGFVGQSRTFRRILQEIDRLHLFGNTSVLITGESGTGKELVARAIYHHSNRSTQPFLAVNCAAIPEQLLESELFGHERGAFTGATLQRVGKFEQCNGGTLFLDEIGDMTPATQTKILRVLQSGTFERVGGNTPLKVDVRIIAATNKPLEEAVANREFREDLFYRLNVVRIHIPPLRERRDDVRLLVNYFLKKFARDQETAPKSISTGVTKALEAYHWPGNVRELENIVRRALVVAKGDAILLSDLPAEIVGQNPSPNISAPSSTIPSAGSDAGATDVVSLTRKLFQWARKDPKLKLIPAVERELVLQALKETSGNQVQAAKLLGITRATLRKRIEKFGIQRELSLK
jgi:DNA-binding NtrC family response regulator